MLYQQDTWGAEEQRNVMDKLHKNSREKTDRAGGGEERKRSRYPAEQAILY